MLIKPDRTQKEILYCFLGNAKPFRAEAIAEKIKPSLYPAD
ncbi:hypothetical protein D1AOALGA4SA_2350 [Olavius algarvensis Delta 1 endosymbiont]|nr:hypothetical protein D1AOALGA4SA_2350 [Olavius algarvensis Delta 1 endosymbiont]